MLNQKLVTACFASLLFLIPTSKAAPILYHHGKIYPAIDRPAVEWMLVENGKVTKLGNGAPPRAKTWVKRDLGGRRVYPGLTDAHLHLADIGEELSQIDLRGAKSAEEAITRVRDFIASHPNEKTIYGNGWDQTDWPGKAFPSRALLDPISLDKPIVLYRIDGHAAWVNSAALRAVTLTAQSKDPIGGKILRTPTGEPSGILVDTAMAALTALRESPSRRQLKDYTLAAVKKAVAHGITGAHDAGAGYESIEAIRELLREGAVNFRFYEMVSAKDPANLEKYLKRGIEVGSEENRLDVRAVKIFADGAMGSRGAAFDTPYADDPQNRGLLRLEKDQLKETFRRIDAAGFQIAVHAIGSRANRVVVEALVETLKDTIRAKRPRLEHAQVLTPELIETIGRLGIVASMQPTHCTSDSKWVVDRIGAARARYAYPWRSLLNAGAPLAFGSDAPIESVNPWPGVLSALTRADADGRTFFPQERLLRTEALRAYTEGAAFASFSEARLGNLAPGKAADFFIARENPLTVSPDKLNNFSVDETYVGGVLVYPSTALH